MTYDEPEPIERLEEIIAHPADRTFNALHDRALAVQKELASERRELGELLGRQESKEIDIQTLKRKISKTHDELMEILKNEEKISREIQENNS